MYQLIKNRFNKKMILNLLIIKSHLYFFQEIIVDWKLVRFQINFWINFKQIKKNEKDKKKNEFNINDL